MLRITKSSQPIVITITAALLLTIHSAPAQETLKTGSVQGAQFESPYQGKTVTIEGVVTRIEKNAFYIQDTGDDLSETSDAILVYAKKEISNSEIQLGQSYSVSGLVKEWRPFTKFKYKTRVECNDPAPISIPPDDPSLDQARKSFMTITEIVKPTIEPIEIEFSLTPLTIDGKLSSKHYDDDQRKVFDPENDALDFWESIEGMQVKIEDAIAIASQRKRSDLWVMSLKDYEATETNSISGVTISPTDRDLPQRIKVNFPGSIKVNAGQRLGKLVGTVTYSEGTYVVELNRDTPIPTPPKSSSRSSTHLIPEEKTITVASYNLHNLANDSKGSQFNSIADQIVYQLKAPDIVAVQEMGDDDGKTISEVTSSESTAARLISLMSVRGTDYQYFDIAPSVNCDGGRPGLNIRSAFFVKSSLIDTSKISSISLERIGSDDTVFQYSRKPIVLNFVLDGQNYSVINIHLASKRGDDGPTGSAIVPVMHTEKKRTSQARAIRQYLDELNWAETQIVVLGDFNDYWFSETVEIILGSQPKQLWNTFDLVKPKERFSYVYNGISQNLDQILIKEDASQSARFSVLHNNSAYYDQTSDHDPLLISLPIPQ